MTFSSSNKCYFASLTFLDYIYEKKWLAHNPHLLLLAIGFYLLLCAPEHWIVQIQFSTQCTPDGTFRFLANVKTTGMESGGPGGTKVIQLPGWFYSGRRQCHSSIKDDTFYCTASNGGTQLDVASLKVMAQAIRGRFMVFPFAQDSSAVEWQSNMGRSMSPGTKE